MNILVTAFVTPGVRRERVIREDGHRWRIAVREPAEDNAANDRVRAIIAGAYVVSLVRVRIVKGHRSSRKAIEVMVQ